MQSNQMEFWRKSRQVEHKINLIDPANERHWENGRIVSIAIEQETAMITFREECDDYYRIILSKQNAIKALQEAINWIEQNA